MIGANPKSASQQSQASVATSAAISVCLVYHSSHPFTTLRNVVIFGQGRSMLESEDGELDT